mgnify:FL=1
MRAAFPKSRRTVCPHKTLTTLRLSPGCVLFKLSPTKLETFNSALVVCVLALFLPLLGLAGSSADIANFARGDWERVPNTIPVIALAFVFHNIIPVVATQLEGDVAKTKKALVVGTAIPFVMFVLWDAALLGSVSQADADAINAAVARSGGAIELVADPLLVRPEWAFPNPTHDVYRPFVNPTAVVKRKRTIGNSFWRTRGCYKSIKSLPVLSQTLVTVQTEYYDCSDRLP